MIDTFTNAPGERWRFTTDAVMDGVYTGSVEFVQQEDETHAHKTGRVSTENNGGFIQMRTNLAAPPRVGATALLPP